MEKKLALPIGVSDYKELTTDGYPSYVYLFNNMITKKEKMNKRKIEKNK